MKSHKDTDMTFSILFFRIHAFGTEEWQMEYSDAKDILDVHQELGYLCHWINLQLLLKNQMSV